MKTVVLLSGGMDSTTLLHYMLKQSEEVAAISFNYGQRHKKELEYAKRTTEKLGIEHKVVELAPLRELLKGCSLTDDIPVPHGHYEAESMKATVVPNRNMIMLSIATGWAISLGFDIVAYAAHAGDHFIYADCRPKFFKALNSAVKLADEKEIQLCAPFINIDKGEIALIGLKLGIDYDDTWTCYEGGEEPCGKCGACVERAEALEWARKEFEEHHDGIAGELELIG